MTNANLLKHAMQFLDLTGVGLAEQVSALRDDGKRTAPETISRWVNGTNPVDPFLMGWMTERVRAKLFNSVQSMVELPKDGLIIGVVNPKGGTGVTSLCVNLAATAKSLHMKATYLHAEYEDARRRPGLVPMMLKPLWIECPDLSPEKILRYQPAPGEIVFVDVSNHLASNSFIYPTPSNADDRMKPDPKGFLDQFRPDFYLIPANLESYVDAAGTKRFIDGNALHAPKWIVHRPRSMSMKFASVAAKAGLDVESEMVCPYFIPQAVSTSTPIPRDILSEWQNEDQYNHHYHLLEELLQKLGGRIMESYSLQQEIGTLSLAGLLELAEKTAAPRRRSA